MKAFLFFFCALTFSAFTPMTSSAETTSTGSAGKIDFKHGSAWYGIINNKVTIIVLTDAPAEVMAKTSSTSEGRKVEGFLTRNGQKVEISCFSSDGDTGHCSVGGAEFDLVQGHIFRVFEEKGTIRIQQVKRDIARVKPDAEGIRKFILNDSELSRFVETK